MKMLLVIAVVAVIGYLGYYFFVDTLMLTEIIDAGPNPRVRILVNLFDFDTDLTRYDIHRLKQKAPYWERRMDEVLRIPDERRQQEEYELLVAEMMEDPVMKKIARKFLSLGSAAAKGTLEAIKSFKTLGFF